MTDQPTREQIEALRRKLIDLLPCAADPCAYDHTCTNHRLLADFAVALASLDEEGDLASVADTVAAAHRNSGMPDPQLRDWKLDTIREAIWQLSYEINRLRSLASLERREGWVMVPEVVCEAVVAMVKDGWLYCGVEGLDKPQQKLLDAYNFITAAPA